MARTTSNDLNKTRYTRRDYESIKEDLIAAIPSLTQEWTSREEADPGIVLIKLMAMFGDTLSYNVDKIALELYIKTVSQRKNCAKILRLLGYKMHWYRSGRVMAHVRLIVNQDREGNMGHMILKPYSTQFVAGNLRYTVINQSVGAGDIDIYSDTVSTPVQLIEGTPVTVTFDKNSLVKNRYYFSKYNLDEKEIVLTIDNIINSKVTCKLVDSLYLVSSNTIIYYEFGIDEFDRPYIELCDGWEDIAGTDTADFTLTYILSTGSQGNVSNNAFSNIYNYEAENVSPANLVINNLSNLTIYGEDENGEYLETYNSPGYDPQTVDDARKDSANYVFTHDTLVTSSDYEKACKRVTDITVSKLVDGQVIINDMLDINDICYRALDRFSKVYMREDSLTNPGVTEVNQYLLAYQVIMYLAYKNFDPQLNYYFNTLSANSFWCLRDTDLESINGFDTGNPYERVFWNPTKTFIGDSESKNWIVGGPVTNKSKGQEVTVSVTVNEQEITKYTYDYNSGEVRILMGEDTPKINSIVINTETNPQNITHYTKIIYDKEGCHFRIEDNKPARIDNLIVNSNNLIGSSCTYDEATDSIEFNEVPVINDVIKVTKYYSSIYSTIELEDEKKPDAVTSLFINGESINNYLYDPETGIITLTYIVDKSELESIIVNGKIYDPNADTPGYKLSEEAKEVLPPGYYPYKPTDNILLSVRDLLSSLKILNVDIDFGTMKVFPFKVEGTIHLVQTVAPQEALQIIEIIDEALVQAYYPDLHPIGQKPDFIEIVDIIQESDPRIKYFDAINNIVEWAPEVQRRLSDFDNIFDTTSAIMYNGLSDNFNLNKRFLRFKFKNTETLLDSEEQEALKALNTENGYYNKPSDYGTAYLINYSKIAGLDHTVQVPPNTYKVLQLNNIDELRALCDDLSFRGFTDVKYVRHLGADVTEDTDLCPVEELNYSESVESITVYEGHTDNTDETVVQTSISTSIPQENLTISVANTDINVQTYSTLSKNTETNTYIVSVHQEYSTKIGSITDTGYTIESPVKNADVIRVFKSDEEIPRVNYTVLNGDIQFDIPVQSGETVKIEYYLADESVVDIYRWFYQTEKDLDSDKVIKKILYLKNRHQDGKDDNITEYPDIHSITVNGTEYFSTDYSLFEDACGEISESNNPKLWRIFNDTTLDNKDGSVHYTFRFNEKPAYTYFLTKRYTDQVDTGQELEENDYYVEKYTLINNTGMQWIEED